MLIQSSIIDRDGAPTLRIAASGKSQKGVELALPADDTAVDDACATLLRDLAGCDHATLRASADTALAAHG